MVCSDINITYIGFHMVGGFELCIIDLPWLIWTKITPLTSTSSHTIDRACYGDAKINTVLIYVHYVVCLPLLHITKYMHIYFHLQDLLLSIFVRRMVHPSRNNNTSITWYKRPCFFFWYFQLEHAKDTNKCWYYQTILLSICTLL